MVAGFSSIKLINFRSHAKFDLLCEHQNIIITGANGIGKTNILEAISMFSVGRGFRHANFSEQLNLNNQASFWAIRAELNSNNSSINLATAYDSLQSAKRLIKIDDAPLSRQSDILQYLTVIWFLPTQSHLFLSGASEKRKYFDRIVYSFEPDHASKINYYDHYVRERSKLLKQNYHDKTWLAGLEAKIVEYSLQIALKRLEIMQLLQQQIELIGDIFPKAIISLDGDAETAIYAGENIDNIEANLLYKLQQSRPHDAKVNRCSYGAHKTQFKVLFQANHRPAELCSTGEQKALLLAILVAQINGLQIKQNQRPIILLLDEMIAHLDCSRRHALFNLINCNNIQLFATGVEANLFEGLNDFQHIALTD